MANAQAPDITTPMRILPSVSGGMMRVSILTELPSLLREMGQDPDRLLDELGLDAGLLADPENILPFRVTGNLLSHCVIRTGCSHLGLLLGQRGGTATLGMVGLLARSSPDVGSALRNLIKYLHHHDQGAVPNLSLQGHTALLGYSIYETAVPASDQIYAGAMAVSFRIMRELCGNDWCPSEVWLPFRKPRDATPFRQFFRVPLRFDAELSALVFPAAWLKFTLQSADGETEQQVKAALQTRTRSQFATLARRAMRAMLSGGKLSQDHLAQHLSVSRRTLIRQLQQEGISYRTLLKEMQHEVACLMLRNTDNSIEHIATSLGYANASSFTRAFKSWTGHTPAEWRKPEGAG